MNDCSAPIEEAVVMGGGLKRAVDEEHDYSNRPQHKFVKADCEDKPFGHMRQLLERVREYARPLETDQPTDCAEAESVAPFIKMYDMLMVSSIMKENRLYRLRNSGLPENERWSPLKRQVAKDVSGVGPALGDLPDFEIPLRGDEGAADRTDENLQRLRDFYGYGFHDWNDIFSYLQW